MTILQSNTRAALGALLILTLAMLSSGCAKDTYAAKGAAEGAKTGAIAGAVGGMVTSMIFGGNVLEDTASAAVFGASSGAVVGAMAGSNIDKQAPAPLPPADPQNQLERMRDELGVDAYNGIIALSDCKHDVAIANAREAGRSGNPDYELAGLWIEALAEADRQQEPAARALYPAIVERDNKLRSESDAEARLREGLQELGEIRKSYGMPAVCEY
ncbi:MAG: hypothetical protein BMS9Abin32_633 [Gammaproteobacteria bacterium]|nr:MAG: hypothetical protein BMS9Abin32_633 [Gammaproteobacteria bacterium]